MAVHRAAINSPVSLSPFLNCTTNGLLECSPDGRLARLLPSLSGACGQVRCRYIRQIPCGRLRIRRLARRFSGSTVSAFRRAIVARDILLGGVDPRCAERQVLISVPCAPAHDRSRKPICGSDSIHSDGVSRICSSAILIDLGSLAGNVAPLEAPATYGPSATAASSIGCDSSARLQDRTPIFPVGITTDGQLAERPPASPSICIEELAPAP
jgi:hypothetical protein